MSLSCNLKISKYQISRQIGFAPTFVFVLKPHLKCKVELVEIRKVTRIAGKFSQYPNLCPPPISSKAVSIKSPVLCRKLTFAQCNRPSDPFDLHVCPLPIGIQYDRPGMEAPCSLWHLLSTTVAIQGLMSTKTQVYSHREHSWR